MSDQIDDANEVADLLLQASLRKHKQSAILPTDGIGICLNCGAAVEGVRRWCNAICRDEWQAERS